MADVCAKLAEEANAIVTAMRKTPTRSEDYSGELLQYREGLNEVISLIMAGNAAKALRKWSDQELDGLFEMRLIDMPHKGEEFNFAKWPENDAAVYKAHEKITAIVNNIVDVCSPGKRAAPANRAGSGAAAPANRAGSGAAAPANRAGSGAAAPANRAGSGAATRNVRTNANRAANSNTRSRKNANAARRNMVNKPSWPPVPHHRRSVEIWEEWIQSYLSSLSDWDRSELMRQSVGPFPLTYIAFRDAEIIRYRYNWKRATESGNQKKFLEITENNFKWAAYRKLTGTEPKYFRYKEYPDF